jgi:hypothetical protein
MSKKKQRAVDREKPTADAAHSQAPVSAQAVQKPSSAKKTALRSAVEALYDDGAQLAIAFQNKKADAFAYKYQNWYTKSLKVVSSFASDRLVEFKCYYEVDPKRKSLGYGTYVIQDYLKNVVPNKFQHPEFDSHEQTLICFFNQLTILKAIAERIDSVLNDIEGELFAEIEDNELMVAKQLSKVSLRAAGALVGVVIEGHLAKVAAARGVSISKRHPSIADLSDSLKAASAIDVPSWRKIAFLADIRNVCAHKKDVEPTPEQVHELIQGGEWLTRNVF